MLTEVEIKFQADQAWEYLTRAPRAVFGDWSATKDFALEDEVAIYLELIKPLK